MTVEFTRGKAYVVDRGSRKLHYGQGLRVGLGIVIRHFRDAFTKKLETPNQTTGVFTVQYPEERLAMPEAFRNFPILLYDDATGQELCTSCFQCERICPPQVIHIKQANDPATGKAVPAVDEFIIEYDACMSCGLCHEVCPFDAIKMDHDFELSNADHSSMTVDKRGLNRPVSYYETIAPTMWAEVKDSAYKKLQGSLKRRSGTIGIAPQVVDKVKPSAPASGTKPAAAAKPAAAPKPAAPVAAAGKNMSDEKRARLEAIRTANSGKGGDTAVAAAPAEPAVAIEEEVVVEATPAAAPARTASTSAPGQLPFGADNLLGGVPANTVMSEDKLERLKAIRSGNLAK